MGLIYLDSLNYSKKNKITTKYQALNQLPGVHLNSKIQFVSGHSMVISMPLNYQNFTGF